MKSLVLKVTISTGICLPLTLVYNIIVYSLLEQDTSSSSSIISNAESLLTQLQLFIDQFHTFIIQNNISVITANNSLSIDVDSNTPDSLIESWTNRIHILDSIINTRISNIRDLISELQNSSDCNEQMVQDLTERLQRLIIRYGHTT